VWHQEIVSINVPGYDGVANDYFLVRTPAFTPRGVPSNCTWFEAGAVSCGESSLTKTAVVIMSW